MKIDPEKLKDLLEKERLSHVKAYREGVSWAGDWAAALLQAQDLIKGLEIEEKAKIPPQRFTVR